MINYKQNSKGFGLIGLIITLAIIALLFFGFSKGFKQNQVQQGQDAIKQAQDAADKQNQNTLEIQNQLNSQTDVNFHGVLDDAKKLK